MNILKPIRKLFLPSKSGGEATLSSHTVSRRTFFSFFGAGVAVACAPGLFLGPLLSGGNIVQPNYLAGYNARMAAAGRDWAMIEERVFYDLIQGRDIIRPSIPPAPDGTAIFSPMVWKPDHRERVL